MLTGGELRRDDAEVLQRGRASLGWFGRSSTARSALLVGALVFWAAVLTLGVVVGAPFGRLVIPLVFVVLSVLSVGWNWRLHRKIERGLRRPSQATD